MNHQDPWHDARSLEDLHRQLMLAADLDRPPPGSVDRGWAAFGTAVGLSSLTVAVTAPASAASAPAGTVAAAAGPLGAAGAMVAGKTAASAVGLSVAAKSMAIGFVIGMGAIGTSQVVQRTHGDPPTPALVAPNTHQSSTPNAVAAAPKPSSRIERPTAEPLSEPSARNLTNLGRTAVPNSPVTPKSKDRSLAAQAEDLARIKRQLDSGATEAVLVEIEARISSHDLAAIAEDRDALYIEALLRSNRLVEAKSAAKKFLVRYPASPHRGKVQSLVQFE